MCIYMYRERDTLLVASLHLLLFGIGTCTYQEFVMHRTALRGVPSPPLAQRVAPGTVAGAMARGSGPRNLPCPDRLRQTSRGDPRCL